MKVTVIISMVALLSIQPKSMQKNVPMKLTKPMNSPER